MKRQDSADASTESPTPTSICSGATTVQKHNLKPYIKEGLLLGTSTRSVLKGPTASTCSIEYVMLLNNHSFQCYGVTQ